MNVYLTPDGETKSDICKNFNNNIKKLTNKAYVMSKRSLDAESLKNKLKILLDDAPDTKELLEGAGPEIYKHRKLIESKDKNFWDKVDFEKEYGHTENMKANTKLFGIIKTKWSSLNESEMTEIGEIAEELLNLYQTYRVFLKIENNELRADVVGFTIKNKKKG